MQLFIPYHSKKANLTLNWVARLFFFSKDNIENRMDGACARYLNYKQKMRFVPDVLFVNGNSGLNIKSGEAILSEKEKMIMICFLSVFHA